MGKIINSLINIPNLKQRLQLILLTFFMFVDIFILSFGIWMLVALSANENISDTADIHGTQISYNVCYEDSKCADVLEAEKLVKDFVGNKYIAPASIYFVDIKSSVEVFGFQQDKNIYIQRNLDKKEKLKTIVHELLHLQNPTGFDTNVLLENGEIIVVGHNFTESVIEYLTSELTSTQLTKRGSLLEEWVDCEFFVEAFKNNTCKTALEEYFKCCRRSELIWKEQKLKVENYVVFLNAFDNWMIGEEKEAF